MEYETQNMQGLSGNTVNEFHLSNLFREVHTNCGSSSTHLSQVYLEKES
jgi:hypothetical protein